MTKLSGLSPAVKSCPSPAGRAPRSPSWFPRWQRRPLGTQELQPLPQAGPRAHLHWGWTKVQQIRVGFKFAGYVAGLYLASHLLSSMAYLMFWTQMIVRKTWRILKSMFWLLIKSVILFHLISKENGFDKAPKTDSFKSGTRKWKNSEVSEFLSDSSQDLQQGSRIGILLIYNKIIHFRNVCSIYQRNWKSLSIRVMTDLFSNLKRIKTNFIY